MPAISVDNPYGYIIAVHDHDNIPRRRVHPTVSGGAVGTHHGYKHVRRIVIKFIQESEIETVIRSYEVDGYRRDQDPQVDYSVHEQVKLYNVQIELVKYSASQV
jgi:hypothetical protein